MPATSPFKSAIPWNADCLNFDRDVQNLTAPQPLFAIIPPHGNVGTALAFLETPAVPRGSGEANHHHNRKGTHNGKSLL